LAPLLLLDVFAKPCIQLQFLSRNAYPLHCDTEWVDLVCFVWRKKLSSIIGMKEFLN
jgi:hypothetical protein